MSKKMENKKVTDAEQELQLDVQENTLNNAYEMGKINESEAGNVDAAQEVYGSTSDSNEYLAGNRNSRAIGEEQDLVDDDSDEVLAQQNSDAQGTEDLGQEQALKFSAEPVSELSQSDTTEFRQEYSEHHQASEPASSGVSQDTNGEAIGSEGQSAAPEAVNTVEPSSPGSEAPEGGEVSQSEEVETSASEPSVSYEKSASDPVSEGSSEEGSQTQPSTEQSASGENQSGGDNNSGADENLSDDQGVGSDDRLASGNEPSDSSENPDNGQGNDDKLAADDSSDKGNHQDSELDHDNGQGNDDKLAADDSSDKGNHKDSDLDHDRGHGNDFKVDSSIDKPGGGKNRGIDDQESMEDDMNDVFASEAEADDSLEQALDGSDSTDGQDAENWMADGSDDSLGDSFDDYGDDEGMMSDDGADGIDDMPPMDDGSLGIY